MPRLPLNLPPRSSVAAPASESTTALHPQRSALAALLDDAPGGPWSMHRVERERGPCRHTVRAALRGEGMRADAIERLARLLSVPVALVRAAVEATKVTP